MPTANYNGPDSFTYKANDGAANKCGRVGLNLVGAVEQPPVASSQSVVTAEERQKE